MKSKIYYLFLLITLVLSIQSCKKEDPKVVNISAHGLNKSHNMGNDCMDCHRDGGEGTGVYFLAGTVYDSLMTNPLPDGDVKLFTGPDGTGTLKYTIPVDALGNFYTTELISFGSGLYPAVQKGTSIMYMSGDISQGSCNSCHGITTDKIYVY
ncbi:MAG: hypothetical protein A2W91_19470 [Bacteroidetes bacterium GWF2_38_335]|nr:MAG: hypothetical protein A2W91_19470 [Bacteroidetes bacterium GWF2_38_335]OFY79938.1 MAG: hypothetical protein A2281_10870 [Bacteroidetes bacterium RIFOXYA12_FULL_38_20]HBS86396.1 hypothetical protein [Bacteroidales bacterium]